MKAANEPGLQKLTDILRDNQHRIFDLGGEVSIPGYSLIKPHHVDRIEAHLDEMNEALQPLENFILPGGTHLIASIHVARSICRRAERDLVTLAESEPVNPDGLRYLNRLSDYLFVAARFTAYTLDVEEVLWQQDKAPQ